MKKLIFIIFSLIVVLSLCACEDNNGGTPTSVTNTEKSNQNTSSENTNKNKIITDSFEAVVDYDGDHYILTISTFAISDRISITYDDKKFLLDNTDEVFEDAEYYQEKDLARVSLKLSENDFYRLNFISLQGNKIELGKNLFVQ